MDSNREYVISLTGTNSHKIIIPLGQGSFSIGTKGLSEGKYDIWVEKDCAINWDAFDELYTGYGQERKADYPYGDWPRWFYYSGNDIGFIKWSCKRRIEEFHWMPVGQADITVDFTDADIFRLYIHTKDCRIHILTGEKTAVLTLSGTLENFDIKEGLKIPCLTFYPDCPKEMKTYQLPVYRNIAQAKYLDINNSPVGAAFDCASLIQFQDIQSLDLHGNMTNMSALAALKNLESIALRYIPNLQDMPRLDSWDKLISFIGYNIEENAGKRFRAELSKMKKERTMRHASVSKLRKQIWFETEYGIPFSGWEEKTAKKAATAYKSCFNTMKKAQTEEEIHHAIVVFVEKINRLNGIETTEREDVGDAIKQLIQSAPLDISPEKWMLWFDETRNF